MVKTYTDIIWFDADRWIGSEVAFDDHLSKWRLGQKLHEAADYEDELLVKNGILGSEARGVFACSNIHDEDQQAVIKIRMQIPYFNTAFNSRQKRSEQADQDMRLTTKREIEALIYLTKVGCSSTPAFLVCKHETQGEDDWVPGGFVDYILMEKLPGILPPYWSGIMDRPERDQLREAFKKVWLVNRDEAVRNLIWDSKNQKCYIVDWEDWVESTEDDIWRDTHYTGWNLAEPPNGTLDDMSRWVL